MTHTGAQAHVEPGGMIRLTIYGPLIDDFVVLDFPHAVEALASLRQAVQEVQAALRQQTDGG